MLPKPPPTSNQIKRFKKQFWCINQTPDDAPEVKSRPAGRERQRYSRFHLTSSSGGSRCAPEKRCCRRELLLRFFVINLRSRAVIVCKRPAGFQESKGATQLAGRRTCAAPTDHKPSRAEFSDAAKRPVGG